jgi:hypothetical protein
MHFEHTGGTVTPFHEHDSADTAAGRNGRVSGAGNGNGSHHLPAQMSSLLAENQELRAEVERLKAERVRATEILNRLMEAVGTSSVERLVHDVRNVLNERELYRALADATM